MGQVQRLPTRYTQDEIAQAIHSEANVLFPGAVNPEMLAMLMALVNIETANGTSLNNNNPGNLIASTSTYKGQWFRPIWWTDAVKYPVLYAKAHKNPPEAPQAFRAYMTLEDGMSDYLKLLAKPRFEPMIVAAREGNPEAFALAYKETGYAPDSDPKKHGKTFAQLYAKLLPTFKTDDGAPLGTVIEVDSGDAGKLGALLAAGAMLVGVKLVLRRK